MNYHQPDNNFNHGNYGMNNDSVSGLSLSKYTAKTFGWMFVGLMVTFVTAFFMAVSGLAITVLSIPAMSIILCIAQVAVVIFLSAKINSISAGAATSLFLAYSFLTGITFSSLFYSYGFGSVIGVFLLTSLYFGALSAFGYFTNVDLSKLGPLLMGGVIFLIISGVILIFINIPILETMMCLAGIVIFLGMTAYDTQKIKQQYYMFQGNQAMLGKASVISALQLYLDFINLFIYLLRFMGNRND
ncbi:MAG: Bax inhibitor-1/YccA family protein [Eubacteriales bacterium]